ncbi:MAG TPA: peptidase S10 [Planctomycetota bacterium]|nr:peptidase S10 [Planctomycetota bacterium]
MTTPLRVASLLALLSCGAPASAQAKPAPAPQPDAQAQAKSDAQDQDKDDDEDEEKEKEKHHKDEAKADADPAPVVTEHEITVNGKTLHYHATAGYIVLKAEGEKGRGKGDGDDKSKGDADLSKDNVKPKAKVFFVAYTLDGVTDPATRPVTFAFNGGPGSASVWLHMAAMAPRRAKLTDEGEAPPPPYQLVDNESTWLDDTDLVFIDPVSTGFSRPVGDEDARQFHGLQEDIASVGDFIRLYTTRNERWLSPKIVLGESYGTTRAAGLSDYLQNRYGLYLNGIVLVSSVLSFQSLEFTPQNDSPFVGFLPTYAATAWYHEKLPADLQAKSVAEVAELARAFAGSDYTLALSRGDTLSHDDLARVAGELARFTGLPAAYWQQRRLRVPDGLFFTKLLEDEGRIVGRFDSRFTGLRYEPGTDGGEYDPSDEAVSGPLTAAMNDYLRRELGFQSDLTYETLVNVYPWNFGDAGGGFPNTAEDLRRAMTRNPYLKVWVTCSYYDVATPFYGAELAVASMNLDPSVRSNLRFTYYDSGHMLYIHTPSRVKFKTDFEAFLKDATTQQPVHAAAR